MLSSMTMAPRELQSQHLRHARTLPSLSDSIQSLRDPAPYDLQLPSAELVPSSSPNNDPYKQSSNPLLPAIESIADKNAATSLLRSGSQRFKRPLYSQMGGHIPRSPKERFQALMASDNSPSQDSRRNEQKVQTDISPRVETDAGPRNGTASIAASSSSTPTMPSTPPPLPPQSPRRMAEERPSTDDERKPSVDSTSSEHSANISSTGFALRSSHSSNVTSFPSDTTDPEPASLIASAGSAEAVIRQLLKERQATATRSEQLWRLVEQQRTMLLGLNQDLERALKDKERYRKKLKEHIALAAVESGSSVQKDKETPRSASSVYSEGKGGLSPRSPFGFSTQVMSSEQVRPTTPSRIISHEVHAVPPVEELPRSVPASPHNKDRADSALSLMSTERSPPRKMMRSTSEQTVSSALPNNRSTPPSTANEKTRRAPPIPLDLSHAQKPITPLIVGQPRPMSVSEYSESDYAESPQSRRRRSNKTDDYCDSELRSIEEERRRSRSSKESTPASDFDTPYTSGNGLGIGLPLSPRAPPQSALPPSMSSVATLLKMQDDRVFARPQVQTPGAPLMSPGLPSSPRPSDRPFNVTPPRPTMKSTKSSPSLGSTSFQTSQHPPMPRPPVLGIQPSALQPVRSRSYGQSSEQSSTLAEQRRPTSSSTASIYKGLISDQHPHLLLPPNALPIIKVKVDTSRLRQSRAHLVAGRNVEEEFVFTLAIFRRSDGMQLWRVEKTLPGLGALDQALKHSSPFGAKLPDKSLFNSHAPSKVDARRLALDDYFVAVLDTPMNERAALVLCDFFSTDAFGANLADPAPSMADIDAAPTITSLADVRRRKEGYLSKKGKSFGGWKSRYFILDGTAINYYDGPGGGRLGSIKLAKSQIAKQTGAADDVEYRHAFMIMEPKREGSSSLNRHILCAESDEERDGWVEALLPYIEMDEEPQTPTSARSAYFPRQESPDLRRQISAPKPAQEKSRLPLLQTVGYDQTVAADAPMRGSERSSWSPSTENGSDSGAQLLNNLANGLGVGTSVQTPPGKKPAKEKKRGFFGFRSRGNDESAQTQQKENKAAVEANNSVPSNEGSVRGVFGIPLAEASEFYSPKDVDICLPAPVYRCIEYLEAKRAGNEEGIFRLSGSSLMIKSLKESFNNDGDFRLLGGQHYDVHAVASLLKLYLRELPESILTRELHLDFLKVIDSVEDVKQKALNIGLLVHKLPEPNLELVATLSRFLIDIVNNSDVNKMTVRNVGIVFSPTLNLPGPLISLFLTDYGSIFGTIDASNPSSMTQNPTFTNQTNAADGIRSQPAPSYNTSGFSDQPRSNQVANPSSQHPLRRQQSEYVLQDPRAAYGSTGFVPFQQSYESPPLPKRSQHDELAGGASGKSSVDGVGGR